MDNLPTDIVDVILFNYLSIKDIRTCILTSKIFHVLSDYKKNIIKHTNQGWMYCITNGYLESSQWIYQLKINLNSPINIHGNSEEAFRYSCRHGHLETSKWLYKLGMELNSPIDININDGEVFIYSDLNKHVETSKWLYSLKTKRKNHINTLRIPYLFYLLYPNHISYSS